MTLRLFRRALVVILVAGGAVGCDQVTKRLAHDMLSHHPPVALLGGVVRLIYAENAGAFLSLGAGLPDWSRHMIFGIGALIGLAALAVHAVLRQSRTAPLVAMAGIAGGGAGNIIDRFMQGSVRDFMMVGVGPVRTGIFNVADMIIMAGIGVLFWDAWRHRGEGKEKGDGGIPGGATMTRERAMTNDATSALRPAVSAIDWAEARRLLREYEASLEFALDFQDFEHEIVSLETEYGPPGGCFLLDGSGGAATGCVGVRRFSGDACEMKRLYVAPASRGRRTGRRLAEGAIAAARRLGYGCMLLDTVPSMETARRLYASLGFVTRAPYRPNPIPGAVYMELELSRDVRPASGVSGMGTTAPTSAPPGSKGEQAS